MEITLENADEVYAFYGAHRQPVMRARAAYAYLAARYRPAISYDDGARDQTIEMRRRNVRFVVCANHLSDKDQFVLAATAFRTPLRRLIGHIRVLAKDELFDDAKQRAQIDVMGGIPVFRPKDHQMRAAVAAGRQMIDVCVDRATRYGDSIAVFPEGTCNVTDPSTLLPIASGIGHIAHGIAENVEVALLPIGIAYPDDTRVGARVMMGAPELIDPAATPAAITRRVRTRLQNSVSDARGVLDVA
ncbi:lysophospholipid acyltransferase family protein [Williamsia maris]|uniref:Acyltransferase n=1 Tax=Williamsia maris TaxID=72806 RepID=A0ABT1HD45_9NOCA|nr:1-acyl-sn-glycerol-3-phosphate acyltransferase [Williamsia maris]MCP2175593.1 Acyltransferase [Williamsia maris]